VEIPSLVIDGLSAFDSSQTQIPNHVVDQVMPLSAFFLQFSDIALFGPLTAVTGIARRISSKFFVFALLSSPYIAAKPLDRLPVSATPEMCIVKYHRYSFSPPILAVCLFRYPNGVFRHFNEQRKQQGRCMHTSECLMNLYNAH
jgi:hypothetical protein